MKENIKKALYDLIKGVLPLITTFFGVVLADRFGSSSSTLTAFVSGSTGTLLSMYI